jgi:hypothetical protein
LAAHIGAAFVVLCGLASAETIELRGIVVDESGAPVPSATVSVVTVPHGFMYFERTASTQTDDDGRFALRAEATRIGRLFSYYVAQHSDYGLSWTVRQAPNRYGVDISDFRFVLPKRGSIRGRVTDNAGNPAKGAVVSAFVTLREEAAEIFDERFLFPCESLISATSGADGTFVLDGLPAESNVILRVKHPDFATALAGVPSEGWASGVPVGLISVGAHDVAIELEPGATIEGTVAIEETGEPAAGAAVIAFPEGQNVTVSVIGPEKTETDADGHYVLRGLAPAKYVITVASADTAPQIKKVEISSGTHLTGQDISLEEGVLVSGTFVHARSRKPVTRGELILTSEDIPSSFWASRWVIVKADGTFAFRHKPGNVTVTGIDSSGVESHLELTLDEGQDVTDVVLETAKVRAITFRPDTTERRIAGKQAFELDVAEWVLGEATTLEELQGNIVVLALWDSRDESSAEVIEALNSLAKKHPDMAIIAVHSADGDRDALQQLMEEKNVLFSLAIDKPSFGNYPGATFKRYKAQKPALVYIIDAEGKVKYQDIPLAAVEEALKQLLDEQ